MFKHLLTTIAVVTVAATGAAQAQEKLRIGVMATLEGALTTLGEDGIRGLQLCAAECLGGDENG
jgi:branched-chain amino acid transport system substrate-binding protein